MKLIFAQGNPEPDYSLSRHNAGFLVLNTIVTMNGAKWSNKSRFSAFIAEVKIGDEKVILAKPTTHYNETGISVKKLIDFYKLDSSNNLLVIHDDLSLPFGTIRVRKEGRDAGNNGIKSINTQIKPNYARIKIGINSELKDKIDDATFVLAKFSNQELGILIEKIIPQTIKLTTQFCNNSIEHTSHKIS